MSVIQPTERAGMLVERLPLVTYTLRSAPSFPPLYVSPQLEALFGFPAAAIMSDDEFWFSRMAREDVGRYRVALEHLRATHEPKSHEYRVTAGDGRAVWVRDVAGPAREDDGELYIHGYLSGVTREKTLERELAAERAQAVAFFRDSPVGLGISDEAGRYTHVNDALARLNGTTVADFVGRTLAEVSPDVAVIVDP